MPARVVIIEGHPDAGTPHLGHAFAQAYAEGAEKAGHEVRRIAVGTLDFPLLASRAEWENGTPPDAVRSAQHDIAWANHLAIFYPLWLGAMPARLKGFFEQAFRPGFALAPGRGFGGKLLKGRSALIVVTMGMPALVYRLYFGAHSLKSFERNILKFVGIGPIRETLFGLVEAGGAARHARAIEKLRRLGAAAR